MSADESKALADLHLEVEGVGLLRPALTLEIAIPWAEGPEVLDFYRQARRALGGALSYYSSGSGRWSKLTAKSDETISKWCQDPQPYPKKTYFAAMQGAKEGITAARMEIDFVMRPYVKPTPELLAKWLDPAFHPNFRHSNLSVSFPLEHPMTEPDAFVTWVSQLEVIKEKVFISGTAGYGIDFPENAPTPWLRSQAAGRAGELLVRYPGLDIAARRLGISHLLRKDVEYMNSRCLAAGRPYSKRAGWLNLLGEDQVAILGGVEALRRRFAETPSIRIHGVAHGVIVRAGDRPRLGAAGEPPPEYVAVAKAIARVCVPATNPASMGAAFHEHGAERWLHVLARA